MAVDLLFQRPGLTTSPVDLVFGEEFTTLPGEVLVTVVAALPGLSGAIVIREVADTIMVGTLPAMTGALVGEYVSGAARPTVSQVATDWQKAQGSLVGVEQRQQAPEPYMLPSGAAWQIALPTTSSTQAVSQDGDHSVFKYSSAAHSEALKLAGTSTAIVFQDGLRDRRTDTASPFSEALKLQARSTAMPHQDGIRDRRNWAAAQFQQAVRKSAELVASSGAASWLNVGRVGVYQEAMRPLPGTSLRPVPPVSDPCYTPPAGDEVHLLFVDSTTDSTDLVFVCEVHGPGPEPDATVVVPVKRVYVVLNESSLRRVDGDVQLPTFSMSMSLDVDSWTWSFSAALPGTALSSLQPSAPGVPILVEATINGVPYRMQVERRSRDRSFASDGIKISGRGLAAVLDVPHSPVMNHTNVNAVTAQQLMNQVLTVNGVSIGWEVDWQVTDWSIPAGVFAQQSSYIAAVNAIAEAAGAYVQPHPTQQTLRVLPRYPALPWDWVSVTPDYEIPADVATTEGIEWVDKAPYNRVFVSGVQDGVLGQITRAGTDGSLVAPMVTDSLITTAAAARQRGIPVLSDTGSQAQITLRMPVLAETGIIQPGKFIKYVDGATVRRGLTRSVSVEVNSPETWQTIVLETHV